MNNYINYNWYRGEKNSKEDTLWNVKEGFQKGNMFMNLYSPYKNYVPAELTPKNEKESLLWELSTFSFAAHELNLYLDIHPNDQSMFLLFMDYQKKANRLMKEYEQKYGPITINSEEMNSFDWINEWPWEGQNV